MSVTISRVYEAVAAALHDEASEYVNGRGRTWADGEAMTFNERMAAGYALNGMAQRFLDQAQEPGDPS